MARRHGWHPQRARAKLGMHANKHMCLHSLPEVDFLEYPEVWVQKVQKKQNYNRCPAQGKTARTDRLSNWSIYHENSGKLRWKLSVKHAPQSTEGVRQFGWLLRDIRVSETAGVPPPSLPPSFVPLPTRVSRQTEIVSQRSLTKSPFMSTSGIRSSSAFHFLNITPKSLIFTRHKTLYFLNLW